MKKYAKDIVNENMTRSQERNLAIKLLDAGFFWLNDIFCKVCSISKNDEHYFINYEDRISNDDTNIKSIIVSQLKEVQSL